MSDVFPLSEVIQNLRTELSASIEAAAKESLQFEVGSVELELNVVVTKAEKGGGGASFKVLGWGLDASAELARSDQNTQRVKLVLTPKVTGPGKSGLAKVSGGR